MDPRRPLPFDEADERRLTAAIHGCQTVGQPIDLLAAVQAVIAEYGRPAGENWLAAAQLLLAREAAVWRYIQDGLVLSEAVMQGTVRVAMVIDRLDTHPQASMQIGQLIADGILLRLGGAPGPWPWRSEPF
jgi:hypothetical protein